MNKHNFSTSEWEEFKLEWKEFSINDLFEVKHSKPVHKNTIDLTPNGECFYVTRTALNNGTVGKTNYYEEKYKNVITIGGEGVYAFYHNYNFITGSNITLLELKEYSLNEYIGLFLINILNLENYKYSYNRARNMNLIKKEIIKLPIKKDNNKNPIINKTKLFSPNGYIPDFEFMEKYILNIFNIFPKLNEFQKIEKQNDEYNYSDLEWEKFKLEWKEFKVNALFELSMAKPIHKNTIDLTPDGECFYVTRTAQNNGTVGKTNDYEKKYKNVITIGGEGIYAFYHNYDFIAGNNITLLDLKEYSLNKYIGIFLTNILNLENYKYSYNRSRNMNLIKKEIIKLPIKKDENNNPVINKKKSFSPNGYIPDFEFMEGYIKNLKYSKYL